MSLFIPLPCFSSFLSFFLIFLSYFLEHFSFLSHSFFLTLLSFFLSQSSLILSFSIFSHSFFLTLLSFFLSPSFPHKSTTSFPLPKYINKPKPHQLNNNRTRLKLPLDIPRSGQRLVLLESHIEPRCGVLVCVGQLAGSEVVT